MGRVSLVGDILECRRPAPPAEARDADAEWTRIESAFAATRGELAEAVGRLERELGSEIADVFRAHQMMLDGLLSSGELVTQLRGSDVDAAGAVRRVFRSRMQKFEALRDPTFQQRADDVADLGRRVLRHLEGENPYGLSRVPEHVVVAARRVLPSRRCGPPAMS